MSCLLARSYITSLCLVLIDMTVTHQQVFWLANSYILPKAIDFVVSHSL